MLANAAQAMRGLQDNGYAVASLVAFFFPVALGLVRRHPSWSEGIRMRSTGLFAGLLLVAIACSDRSDNRDVNQRNSSLSDEVDLGEIATHSRDESTGGKRSNVDVKLVLQLRPGMTEDQVIAILGKPAETQDLGVPGVPAMAPNYVPVLARSLQNWVYNPNNGSWLVLIFENRVLQDGETGGYSITKGLGQSIDGEFKPYRNIDDLRLRR